MFPQRLEVANRTASQDLSQKVEPLLSPSTLNPDWRICPVERRHICMPEAQYNSHIFDIATWVVSFSRSKISYSIRTVLETTINSNIFEFVVLTWP